MYLGQVVETARRPRRCSSIPCTRTRARCWPRSRRPIRRGARSFRPWPASCPTRPHPPAGCSFSTRCPWVVDACRAPKPWPCSSRRPATRALLERRGAQRPHARSDRLSKEKAVSQRADVLSPRIDADRIGRRAGGRGRATGIAGRPAGQRLRADLAAASGRAGDRARAADGVLLSRATRRSIPCSVVKLFLVVAAQLALDAGRLTPHEELDRAMRDMIRWSSNTATNYVIDLLSETTGDTLLGDAEMRDWVEARNRINRFYAELRPELCADVNLCAEADGRRSLRPREDVRPVGWREQPQPPEQRRGRLAAGRRDVRRRAAAGGGERIAGFLHRPLTDDFVAIQAAQVNGYLGGRPVRATRSCGRRRAGRCGPAIRSRAIGATTPPT